MCPLLLGGFKQQQHLIEHTQPSTLACCALPAKLALRSSNAFKVSARPARVLISASGSFSICCCNVEHVLYAVACRDNMATNTQIHAWERKAHAGWKELKGREAAPAACRMVRPVKTVCSTASEGEMSCHALQLGTEEPTRFTPSSRERRGDL